MLDPGFPDRKGAPRRGKRQVCTLFCGRARRCATAIRQDAALLDGLVHLPNCLSAETQQWLGDVCMQLGNGDDVAGPPTRSLFGSLRDRS